MFPLRAKSSRPRKRCRSYRCYFDSRCRSCARSLIVRNCPKRKRLSQRRGVAIGQAPAGLLNACSRLMELLDTPEDIPFLGHLIQREIIYRILKNPAGRAAPHYCDDGRPRQQDSESDHLAQRQLCEAFAHGRTCGHRTDGSFNPSPSVPRIDRDEPPSISKAVEAAEGKGADAYGWGGRYERSLRSRLRERQPIQSRVQPFLWPASHARCQSSSSD